MRIDRTGAVLDTAVLWAQSAQESIGVEGPHGPVVTPKLFGPALPTISADGTYIALAGDDEKAVRSHTLWGVETDTLDVPYVVRYVIGR